MTRGAKMAIGAIIIVIIAAIIAVAATRDSNKTNNSNSGAANTSQSSNSTPAVKNSIVQTKTDPTLGQYLADPNGKPLYTYAPDTDNTSNCTGTCLTTWPPYLATATTALPSGITTFKRSDTGAMQYAYNGMPLYYFTGDSNGQVTGNNVDNFQIAKPAASTPQNNSSSSPNSSGSSNGYPY
jgi:predicted lipoprotein with Yx(FWY)xxD motif